MLHTVDPNYAAGRPGCIYVIVDESLYTAAGQMPEDFFRFALSANYIGRGEPERLVIHFVEQYAAPERASVAVIRIEDGLPLLKQQSVESAMIRIYGTSLIFLANARNEPTIIPTNTIAEQTFHRQIGVYYLKVAYLKYLHYKAGLLGNQP
uniref:Uncharacterized protein n=1 Tax=Ditylenchus dipsaci TaxID=166011 RepID=A0A915DK70_9BILA